MASPLCQRLELDIATSINIRSDRREKSMRKANQMFQCSPFHRHLTGLLTAAVLVSMAMSLGACRKEKKPAAVMIPVVETVTVVQKDVPIKKEWVGVVDGFVNATIRAQVTGYLIRQNYIEGQAVRKGQVLFEIDPRSFQTALNQAKAQLSQQMARYEQAKANLGRVKPLAEKNAVSQRDLDDAVGTELSARASVEAAQAAVEEAQLNLDFTRITSPVDGIAGIAKTQIGDLVGPSAQGELTSVSTLDPIKVYINISEQEYMKAVESEKRIETLPLELILTDGSTYAHQGHFSVMDRQVDPTTGTMKIGILFPNKDNILRPGQYGRIRATIRVKQGALLIPQRAVTEIQGRYLVAVVGTDNKIEIRPVQVGERIGSDWIIDKGLNPGEQVVAEGTQKVRPGMTVTPRPFSAEATTVAPAPAKKE
jgi:membrane fusion protein, multidrug efflux system